MKSITWKSANLWLSDFTDLVFDLWTWVSFYSLMWCIFCTLFNLSQLLTFSEQIAV